MCGEYTLNYWNAFAEANINVENSVGKCSPNEFETNVQDILMNDGQNVSFVKTADNYCILLNYINNYWCSFMNWCISSLIKIKIKNKNIGFIINIFIL